LLDPHRCVVNDVELGPPGTLLLVTGSNMSGKSTLLRSVGLNAVLAQMGAPVCAQSLQMVPVELATSMRISDSLADGVSFFMAELKRLREVVELAGKLGR
jgi:DNA mismatch repair ATPase MutS